MIGKYRWKQIWAWLTDDLALYGAIGVVAGIFGMIWLSPWFWKIFVTGLICLIPVVIKGFAAINWDELIC